MSIMFVTPTPFDVIYGLELLKGREAFPNLMGGGVYYCNFPSKSSLITQHS